MSPFITFKDLDTKGEMQYFILQREYPHYCGRIAYYPTGGAICEVPITGHNLYVSFSGVLRGNFVPAYPKVEEEISVIFHAMALWFYENRVLKEPKRYKKWLI